MAGYSGTPLPKKLGIKEDHIVVLVDAPPNFEMMLNPLPPGVILESKVAAKSEFNVMVCLVKREADLQKRFQGLAKRLHSAGGLWIAWPKKTSGVATDLTENVIRNIGLDAGLVDNKVCAIDATWSGLRFVIRLKDRSPRSPEARG
jgi:hypothetical protein